MDPITLLITLAPLLINYAQEKKSQKEYTLKEFQDWLLTNHHDVLFDEIKSNQGLLEGIKIILKDNHTDVLERLKGLEKQISSVIANNNIGSKLAKGLSPELILSGQAINILKQMNENQSSRILETKDMSGTRYKPMDGKTRMGYLEILEERFILDDLDTLVKHNCLNMELNSNGNRIFIITRYGASIEV